MLSAQLGQSTFTYQILLCSKKWNIHSKIKCRHDQIDLCQYAGQNLILQWGFFILQILKAETCSDASQIQQNEPNSQTESMRHIFTV